MKREITIKTYRPFVTQHFVRIVFDEWLASAMEINSFAFPYVNMKDSPRLLSSEGKLANWVDPQKEMNAAIMGLKSGVSQLAGCASQYGRRC